MPYATVAELKGWIGNVNDASEDTRLTLALDAASEAIDDYCNRRFTTDAVASSRIFHPYRDGTLWLDDVAETASLVVKTDEDADGVYETTWAASDYAVEPANALATGRPVSHLLAVGSRAFPPGPRHRVQVSAKWGWPATPRKVKQACLILAARLWKRKDAVDGLAGNPEFGQLRLARVDPDVATLLDPFALPAVA